MKKKNRCPRCKFRESKHQAAHVMGRGLFDVLTAEKLLKASPRRPKRMTRKQLARLTKDIEFDHPEHLDHVNVRKFGIVGRTPRNFEFILDGSHRAKRCHRDNRPFMYYELNEFETGTCFIGKRLPGPKKKAKK